jgi:hypothetical protein
MSVKAAGALLAAVLGAGAALAQTGPVLSDRYTATTASMTPSDVGLRFDVREWSDEAARAEVVAALEGDAEAQQALTRLPTVGYIWKAGSSVGYSVKYAHRTATPEGERITFVTDKRLGAYDLQPWAANPPAATEDLGYSVVELYLEDGSGVGTLSLAADVRIDAANGLVTLAPDSAPKLLANVKTEPKPYWAKKT